MIAHRDNWVSDDLHNTLANDMLVMCLEIKLLM